MYKHGSKPTPPEGEDKLLASQQAKGVAPEQTMTSSLHKADSPAALRDLLEKNLKWSQIIYEQNRKINHKLMWSAVANWLRFFILVVPFVLAVLYLPPFIQHFKDAYFNWVKTTESGKTTPSSVQDLINLLPLKPAERDQVKAMMQ